MRRGTTATIAGAMALGFFAPAGWARPFSSTQFSQFRSDDRIAAPSGLRKWGQGRFLADRFLEEIRTRYDVGSESSFPLKSPVRIGKRTCLRFGQQYRRADIAGAGAVICYDEAMEVTDRWATVCGRGCLADREGFVMTPQEAGEAAEEELGAVADVDLGTVVSTISQPIWLEDATAGGIGRGFKVELLTDQPYGRYEVYLEGDTGNLLAWEDRVIKAVASGQVYLRDRVTTPDREFKPLTRLTSIDRLSNPYYTIVNEDEPEGASQSTGQYFFEVTDTRFDEVQAYYGMQVALDRLFSWGYESFGPIPIVVHYGEAYPNAFYDGTKIVLGDGDGYNLLNLARDNTVVSHEYGHAVVDQLSNLRVIQVMDYELGDGGAIHEGHADYIACAVFNQPTLGEGVMPDREPMRYCNLRLPYKDKDAGVHHAGQVWSGAMWEARGVLGADVVDKLALHALPLLQPRGVFGATTMVDMFWAVVAADRALFNGIHEAVLQEVFEERGFPIWSKPMWLASADEGQALFFRG